MTAFFGILLFLFVLCIIATICSVTKKKKSFKFVSFVIILVCFFEVVMFKNLFMKTYVETLNLNWNISLPKPDKQINILDSGGSFKGNKESIKKLEYSQDDIKRIKEEANWNKSNEYIVYDMKKFYNESNNKLKKKDLDIGNSNDFLCLHRFKNKENDWITMLLDEKNREVYVFESKV